MSAYELDTTAAKQADSGGRISESGKYIGQFTKAKKVTSTKGTQGIEFSFKADNGQTADYLTIWTINKDGDQIFGYKQLMALMTCIKARKIDTKKANVEEYDSASNGMVAREVEVFPALMDKDIGILLQMEEYEKKDCSVGEKAAFASFFDAKTEQVAIEILDKKDAEILARQVSALQPIKKLKGQRSAPASNHGDPAHYTSGGQRFADMDDDIPFANPYRGKYSYLI